MEQLITKAVSAERQKNQVAKGRKEGRKQQLTAFSLICSDILLAFLVWEGALVLQGIWGHGPLTDTTVASIVPIAAVWIGLRTLMGLYPGYGLDPVEELRRQTYAASATLAVTAVFGLAFHFGDLISRLLILLSFLGLLVLSPLVRRLVKGKLRKVGLWGKPVVIMGAGEPGAQVVRLFQDEWHLGYKPIAVFDNTQAPVDGYLEGVPYGGTASDAMFSDWNLHADTVIFAMPHTRREQIARYVHWASDKFRHVMLIPNLSGVTNSAVVARDLSGVFSVEIKYNLLNPWSLRAKRVLDLGATILGGLFILPLILVLYLLVRLESGGPVFYADWRTGKDGKRFSCLKFRTMVPGAEDILQQLLKEDVDMRDEYMKYHKLRDDPRVTRVGRFLRKTSLDELPQLWNVLRGEMSLVGPRPYLLRESEDVGDTQGEILRVPPGITGPWQVAGRSQTSFEERVGMDAHYVRDWSVWLDIVLLARTVKITLSRGGAY